MHQYLKRTVSSFNSCAIFPSCCVASRRPCPVPVRDAGLPVPFSSRSLFGFCPSCPHPPSCVFFSAQFPRATSVPARVSSGWWRAALFQAHLFSDLSSIFPLFFNPLAFLRALSCLCDPALFAALLDFISSRKSRFIPAQAPLFSLIREFLPCAQKQSSPEANLLRGCSDRDSALVFCPAPLVRNVSGVFLVMFGS